MEIPLYILLVIYLVGVGIFLVSAFFNLYHIFKFGFFDFTGKLNTFLFLGLSTIILVVTFLLLRQTPWLDTFDASGGFFGSPTSITNVLDKKSNFSF